MNVIAVLQHHFCLILIDGIHIKGYDTLEFQADIPPTLTCINQHISNGTPA